MTNTVKELEKERKELIQGLSNKEFKILMEKKQKQLNQAETKDEMNKIHDEQMRLHKLATSEQNMYIMGVRQENGRIIVEQKNNIMCTDLLDTNWNLIERLQIKEKNETIFRSIIIISWFMELLLNNYCVYLDTTETEKKENTFQNMGYYSYWIDEHLKFMNENEKYLKELDETVQTIFNVNKDLFNNNYKNNPDLETIFENLEYYKNKELKI